VFSLKLNLKVHAASASYADGLILNCSLCEITPCASSRGKKAPFPFNDLPPPNPRTNR
jgi:hypothetical protein